MFYISQSCKIQKNNFQFFKNKLIKYGEKSSNLMSINA